MKTVLPSFNRYYCPTCKMALKVKPEALLCESCAHAYLIEDNIPDFISNEVTGSKNNLVNWANSNYNLQARIYELTRYPWRYYLYGGLKAGNSGGINRMIQEILPEDCGIFLDVACGPGTLGRPLAANGRTVYGVDISKAMLRQGENYRRQNQNMFFARALVEKLPFQDAQFDAALCGSALHFFGDAQIALQEIGRTLKTGAPLLVVTLLNSKSTWFRRLRNYTFHPKGTHLFSLAELEQILNNAGFSNFNPVVYGSMVFFSAQKKTIS